MNRIGIFCLTIICSMSANAAPIKEESFVTIGGIPQWVTIAGDDDANPVVLVVHGGPGNAWSPFAEAMFAGWTHDFTMVQWDQRGAGRTYTKNGEAIAPTMTMERMTADGIEVAAYLRDHLHKRKIILLGGSWGSVLGVEMVHSRPDLFYAYVGFAQMVDWHKNVAASYARVLELARAANDAPSMAALTAIGPPPWNDVHIWPKFRKVEQAYQAKIVTAPTVPMTVSPAYASAEEDAQREAADDFSFVQLWGMTLAGPFTHVDLPALGTAFPLPIYIVQGDKDLTALPELARAYFDSIAAPHKEFFLVPGTGHEPSVPLMAVVRKILVEQIRPLALEN